MLRDAGIVIQGRNRLYQIAPQFLTRDGAAGTQSVG
jgi:hypothetical protein